MGTSTWVKLPAIEGKLGGCLNCGQRPSMFPPTAFIAVGFGFAGLTKDGEVVWQEPAVEDYDDDSILTGEKAEELAVADPDHDWRIVLEGPLSGRTYQRHGPGEWALVKQNEGFA